MDLLELFSLSYYLKTSWQNTDQESLYSRVIKCKNFVPVQHFLIYITIQDYNQLFTSLTLKLIMRMAAFWCWLQNVNLSWEKCRVLSVYSVWKYSYIDLIATSNPDQTRQKQSKAQGERLTLESNLMTLRLMCPIMGAGWASGLGAAWTWGGRCALNSKLHSNVTNLT